MSDGTKIEWTEATWNPITGCSVTSPGCTNCYAMKLAGTRLQHHESRKGLTRMSKPTSSSSEAVGRKGTPVWTGQVRFNEQWLTQPLRWKRPRMIFVCAHGDLFHESVPDEWIDRVFAVMALAPQHTFQVLTKRSARMREYVDALVSGERMLWTWGREMVCDAQRLANLIADLDWGRHPHSSRGPLPNVWLGVSVEDQARADERVPDLLATPSAVRWLSCEPLLGPIDLESAAMGDTCLNPECWGDCACDSVAGYDPGCRRNGGDGTLTRKVDWVIVGGESGKDARPLHPDWARSLRDQCAAAGVPFFFKQWGEWHPHDVGYDPLPEGDYSTRGKPVFLSGDGPLMLNIGKKRAGRLLDGVRHDAMPQVQL